MSATEILRRLLDELGVEWENSKPYGAKAVTRFKVNDVWLRYVEYGNYQWLDYHENEPLTPEQAIAATLGQAVRHPKPHEKWTTVLLPEIAWGWDDRWPDYLSVAHDANGEWRTYVPEATLGATDANPTQDESSGMCHPISCNCTNDCTNSERTETCYVDVLNTGDCAGYECSEYIMHCNGCGHEFGHVLYNEDGDVWMSEPPNYCPNCGRRIVDEKEDA